jgi:dipeptidyl aminopeptidase/acylaminoacyl peptidase
MNKNYLSKKFNLSLFHLFFAVIYFLSFSQFTIAAGMKPMSYEEIVTFVKPQWAEISADGKKIAFCSQKGSIEKNFNFDTLHLFDITSGQQKKVAEFEKILQAKWGSKDKNVYVLVKEKEVYKIICYDDREIITLIESEEPIYVITPSFDGSKLYYTLAKNRVSEELKQQEIEEGRVYDLDRDTLLTLTDDSYKHKEREEIWCLNLLSGNTELLTFLPVKGMFSEYYPIINFLHASSDNKRLLVSLLKDGRPDLGGTPVEDDVIVWDMICNEWYDPLNDSIYVEETACWINEKEFVFQQISYSDGTVPTTYSIFLFDANSRQGGSLNWLDIPEQIKKFQWNNGILYAICESNLYKIQLDEKKVEQTEIPKSFYGDCYSFDEQARYIGLINQSIDCSPEIAVYDIEEKKLTRLTSLNPQIEDMALGKVEKITVTTHSGLTTNGFLIHPVGEQVGVHYPIIIGTYGFEGKFMTDAEWHSSCKRQI